MSSQATNQPERPAAATTNWLVVLLLASILTTQVLILLRIPRSPPTMSAVRGAKTAEARTTLLQSIPLVRVQGGTIDAQVTGSVEIENTPLDVIVYR